MLLLPAKSQAKDVQQSYIAQLPALKLLSMHMTCLEINPHAFCSHRLPVSCCCCCLQAANCGLMHQSSGPQRSPGLLQELSHLTGAVIRLGRALPLRMLPGERCSSLLLPGPQMAVTRRHRMQMPPQGELAEGSCISLGTPDAACRGGTQLGHFSSL